MITVYNSKTYATTALTKPHGQYRELEGKWQGVVEMSVHSKVILYQEMGKTPAHCRRNLFL